MEQVNEEDNMVNVAMFSILNTSEALGHSGKSGSPEGSVFTTTQDITVSGPPGLFLG